MESDAFAAKSGLSAARLVWLASGKWPDCASEVPYDFKAACEQASGIPKEGFGF
jgi:hypothetical protein